MLKNYIIITFRNMMRNKLYTLINITGLSVSLACCILLFMYSTRELGYDRQNKNVYRLTSFISEKDGRQSRFGTSPVPITVSLPQEIPGVERTVRACNADYFGVDNLITYDEKSLYIKDGYYVDSTFFSVLKFDIIQGNPDQPFSNSSSVVLEKDWAKKLFGNDNPLGKRIKIPTIFGLPTLKCQPSMTRKPTIAISLLPFLSRSRIRIPLDFSAWTSLTGMAVTLIILT